jgi:hypothetical protein
VRAVHCKKCGALVDKGDLFCRVCGSSLVKKQPLSDFEIGKVAALDTIKSDFIKWIGSISLLLAILGIFGFNKVVDSAVTEKVTVAMDTLRSGIEKASVEATLKFKTLSSELDTRSAEIKQKEGDLTTLIDTSKSNVNRLKEEEGQIAKVIGEQNFVLAFKKLDYDLFRIKDISAKLRLNLKFNPQNSKKMTDYLTQSNDVFNDIKHNIAVSLDLTGNNDYFVEFGNNNFAARAGNLTIPSGIGANIIMYNFHDSDNDLINTQIDTVSKIKFAKLSIELLGDDDKSKLLLKSIDTVSIDVAINAVPIIANPILVSRVGAQISDNHFVNEVPVHWEPTEIRKQYEAHLAGPAAQEAPTTPMPPPKSPLASSAGK